MSNLYRHYADRVNIADFSVEESRAIGETLRDIDAVAYGEQAEKIEEYAQTAYVYRDDRLSVGIVDDGSVMTFQVHVCECASGGQKNFEPVFLVTRLNRSDALDYFVICYRPGFWQIGLHELAKNDSEVQETVKNFSPYSAANAFK